MNRDEAIAFLPKLYRKKVKIFSRSDLATEECCNKYDVRDYDRSPGTNEWWICHDMILYFINENGTAVNTGPYLANEDSLFEDRTGGQVVHLSFAQDFIKEMNTIREEITESIRLLFGEDTKYIETKRLGEYDFYDRCRIYQITDGTLIAVTSSESADDRIIN